MADEFEITGDALLDVPQRRMTGRAWIRHLGSISEPAGVRMAKAYFEPRSRTVWHRHWKGQILHVLDGVLLIQERGRAPEAYHPGDAVACEPNVWHWHGASSVGLLSVIAVIETNEEGQDADWGDPVSDEEFATADAPAAR